MKKDCYFVCLFIYVSIAAGQTFHDQDVPTEEIWDRLFEPRDLSQLDARQTVDDDAPEVPIYPKLNRNQAEFAVNPSFDSYYDPSVKPLEIKLRTEKQDPKENDEVASDPFESESSPESSPRMATPKKAMHDPLIGRAQPLTSNKLRNENRMNDIYFISFVTVGTAMTVLSVVGAGFCYHRVRRNSRAGEEVEYPAYGVTGPGKEVSPSNGDRKLAQSAQMYHYQHQKQQMIAFDRNNQERRPNGNGNNSDNESEDGEEGDYTVYECPGLAPTGEMEVRNPLFQDEPTPKANQ